MRSFGLDPGFWGGAQLTAADLARFYWRLERNFPGRYREYGMRLLAHITETQRVGHPGRRRRQLEGLVQGRLAARRTGGHDSGPVTHQGALLVHRGGQRSRSPC